MNELTPVHHPLTYSNTANDGERKRTAHSVSILLEATVTPQHCVPSPTGLPLQTDLAYLLACKRGHPAIQYIFCPRGFGLEVDHQHIGKEPQEARVRHNVPVEHDLQ